MTLDVGKYLIKGQCHDTGVAWVNNTLVVNHYIGFI